MNRNMKFKPLAKLNLQHFAETVKPQNAPQNVQQTGQTVDIDSIVNNVSARVNQVLNDRLTPIEQKLNAPPPITKEQVEAQNEQLRQQFENNPMEFVNNIQSKAKEQAMNEFKQQYDPIIQKTQQLGNRLSWQDNVRQFMSANPDAQKNLPQITQVLQENPELMQTKNPLDIAYKLALSNGLIGGGGNVVEGILSNEEYKAQLMQNPQLKEAIIQEYQKGLNNGSATGLPPVMGNEQSGTSIPVSSGEYPKNLKEAKQSALRRLQGL